MKYFLVIRLYPKPWLLLSVSVGIFDILTLHMNKFKKCDNKTKLDNKSSFSQRTTLRWTGSPVIFGVRRASLCCAGQGAHPHWAPCAALLPGGTASHMRAGKRRLSRPAGVTSRREARVAEITQNAREETQARPTLGPGSVSAEGFPT